MYSKFQGRGYLHWYCARHLNSRTPGVSQFPYSERYQNARYQNRDACLRILVKSGDAVRGFSLVRPNFVASDPFVMTRRLK